MFCNRFSPAVILVVAACLFISAQINAQTSGLRSRGAVSSSGGMTPNKVNPPQFLRWSLIDSAESPKAFIDRTRRENKSMFSNNSEDAILYNNLGVALQLKELYPLAEEAFKRAVKADPEMAPAWVNLSIYYASTDQRSEALKAATKAADLEPKNERAVEQLCLTTLLIGRADEATRCFERLGEFNGWPPETKASYATALDKAGRSEQAEKIFGELSRANPHDVTFLNGLGMTQVNQKKLEEAMNTFRRATELDPEYAPARFNLAVASLGLRNRAAALSQYKFLKRKNVKLAEALYKMLYGGQVVDVSDIEKRR